MPETIEELVKQAIASAQAAGDLPEFEVGDCGIERPADSGNGDWTSTVAMRSARLAKCAPAKIAAAIVAHMPSDARIARVEVAGPGFINFYLNTAASNEVFQTVRKAGADWGKCNVGDGLRVQVEFISANPTGPLHVGHGRWAAIGDSLCNVLEHANYDVQREYYVNDHGSQMDVFGTSVVMRYLQICSIIKKRCCDASEAAYVLLADREAYIQDEDDEHPELHPYMDAFNAALGGNSYGGDYIIRIAQRFYRQDGAKWVDVPAEERDPIFRERAYRDMLGQIKATCDQVRCEFDEWRSERSFYEKDENGVSYIDRTFKILDEKGLLYRGDDGALWFRSTDYGDDKDRVLRLTSGAPTTTATSSACSPLPTRWAIPASTRCSWASSSTCCAMACPSACPSVAAP